MSLPVRNLDDRRFQDLVDEAKTKIPDFCPSWTNHNVSDPGVALIELFAWMTEMSIFRLNQVPDVFYTRMLNLLGFKPFQRKAATTELTFWLTSDALRDAVVIEADTEVGTVGLEGEARVFTTTKRLDIKQQEPVAVLTHPHDPVEDRFIDGWTDLMVVEDESLLCFPGSYPHRLGPSVAQPNPVTIPPQPGAAFYLGFEESLAQRAIVIEIEADPEGIGIRPDQPPISWEVWTGTTWKAADVPEHDRFGHPGDTTGGLNRDGSLVLLLPNKHEPRELGASAALYWLRARLVSSDHRYEQSPQVRTLAVKTVGGRTLAEHSSPVTNEVLGTSNGKSGQVFTLAHPPLLSRDLTERSDQEHVRVITNTGENDWTETPDFVDADENTRCYVIDASTGEIRFGPSIRHSDGTTKQHGAIPELGAQILIDGYRTGGGQLGNVGARTLSGLRSSISFVAAVTNLEAATGGVDEESVEDAKARGPQAIQTGSRAVTQADFERLARDADRDVERVLCIRPAQPGDPIEVAIVPTIADRARSHPREAYALPDRLAHKVSKYIDDRRLLGDEVEVRPFHFQGVSVAADVIAQPIATHEASADDNVTHYLTVIRRRVDTAISRFINPLTGGADERGWPLGKALNAGDVLQIIEAVEGVKHVERVVLFDYDLGRLERVRGQVGKDVIRLLPNTLFLSADHQVAVR